MAVAVITTMERMARWEPGARERLGAAALELYAARGFEQTTATDIAQSVGLTERTFFRYFADKREVLFGGQEVLQKIVVEAIASAPSESSTIETAMFALEALAEFFPDEQRAQSRLRQTVIVANPGLQERELLKLAALAQRIAGALVERGVVETHATLAAETGVAVFGVAFRQWISDEEARSFDEIQRDVFATLRLVTQA